MRTLSFKLCCYIVNILIIGKYSNKMEITNANFLCYFNSIITKGKKDNTYKFALARFLIDYSYALDETYVRNSVIDKKIYTINLSIIAKAFLKYYWH